MNDIPKEPGVTGNLNPLDPLNDEIPTQTLREWDNTCVWHPFTPMQAWVREEAPIIQAADGFDLIDTDGRRYLDGISSLWCNVHGHRVPEIDAAAKQQLDRVAHSTMLGLTNEPAVRLARALRDRVPGNLPRVFYSDSGATSVEVALKIAYQYHRQKPDGPEERDLFLCVSNAYHGDTIGTVSVGGIDLFHRVYRHLLFPTAPVSSPGLFPPPDGLSREQWAARCLEELEQAFRQHGERAAGFVLEPLVQGAAGILVHPEGYLRRVRELCDEYQILLIADEVAVGFGRTGTLFACEQEDVVPDILCVAKGISGGYLPLAATVTSELVYEAFLGEPHEGRTFYHGHTYTGNPVACAAALASLRLFDTRNVMQNVADAASVLQRELEALQDHPHVADIRQKGLMVGIDLVQQRDPLAPFPAERRTGHLVTLEARKRGVILRPLGDTIVLMPAPAMPTDLVRRLVQTAVESITAAVG